jgi:putative transcriptional regulator
MAKFSLDRKRPPELAAVQAMRLDAMSEDDIAAAARSDPDNPPLAAEELARIRAARRVRRVRIRSGLSQTEFARAFHINVARLRDLEQGRTQADSALLAYLAVIDEAPDTVRRALRSAG